MTNTLSPPTSARHPAWVESALIYHLYPLGTCGAPWTNPGGEPVPRFRKLADWADPAGRIGADTLLLGPIWESGTHGYDTHDYRTPDRRLGTTEDVLAVFAGWKAKGFRIVLDGVFNHCGRGFFAFADLVAHGSESRYRDWFAGVDFSRRSPFGDPFAYEGWNGHLSLVKFNLKSPEVRQYLLDSVALWIDVFGIDGLRLDAADVVDPDFLRELSAFCKAKRPDFWLLGEVIHGDYNHWAPGAGLDAVTNYELFKGLWSSHNDANYFEVAWTLNRQFGPQGLYRDRLFSTFGDNHDVDRLASTLKEPAHLYSHAILQATVPGIPTVYYGTEAGQIGRKTPTGDEPLRPALVPLDLEALDHQPLRELWGRLASLRRRYSALRTGSYEQALVTHHQLAFWRLGIDKRCPVLVAVNSAGNPESFSVTLPGGSPEGDWIDVLNPGEVFPVREGKITGTTFPRWGRILVPAPWSSLHI
jgi:glycosidase